MGDDGGMCGCYRLGAQIGAGGMGRVYVASDVRSGATVALKILDRRTLPDDTARALELLDAPNVVRVLEHGRTHDGASYLVMDLVGGIPLGRHLRRVGALSFARILGIATQLLDGLHAIHGVQLVHGDVKSDNVMVDVDAGDHVVIIDHGLGLRRNADRTFTGTPEYVAPEVIVGQPASAASDLYGAAIVLYEMVTGTTPFAGGTPDEIFERQVVERPPPMSAMCPGRAIPPELELLIQRALAKDPAARPASAHDLARELRHALPASHEDEPPQTARFSTSEPTQDWARPTFSETVSSLVR